MSRAVGYDEERGDKIEVLNVPFEVETLADEKGAIDSAERKEMIYGVGKYAFYIAIFSCPLFLPRETASRYFKDQVRKRTAPSDKGCLYEERRRRQPKCRPLRINSSNGAYRRHERQGPCRVNYQGMG